MLVSRRDRVDANAVKRPGHRQRLGQHHDAALAGAISGDAGQRQSRVHRGDIDDRQNSFAERLIGSIRRECLDHIIVLGEAHLRRILKSYARYYNETRTHLALDKDAPLSRTVKSAGRILCRPVLGGLHHEYVRI
jgi:hypothetical protein